VPQPKRRRGLAEAALVPRAVVGEHATHADPLRVEERDRVVKEADRVDPPRGLQQLGIDEPAREVDRHVEMAPADLAWARAAAGVAVPAAAVDRAERLDVHGDELARLAHVDAPEAAWRLGEGVREPIGAVAAEDAVTVLGCRSRYGPSRSGPGSTNVGAVLAHSY